MGEDQLPEHSGFLGQAADAPAFSIPWLVHLTRGQIPGVACLIIVLCQSHHQILWAAKTVEPCGDKGTTIFHQRRRLGGGESLSMGIALPLLSRAVGHSCLSSAISMGDIIPWKWQRTSRRLPFLVIFLKISLHLARQLPILGKENFPLPLGSVSMRDTLPMHVIATMHSAFPAKFGIPRQSGLVDTLRSTIVFQPEYRNQTPCGLEGSPTSGWCGFFSQAVPEHLVPTVRPPRLGRNTRMGGFATRSPLPSQPHRPFLRED